MKITTLAAFFLAASTTFAFADSGLSDKVMKDSPGVTGAGTTANPTAKPDSGSLSEKAMKDSPGVTGGGKTTDPTAKPDDHSLTGKEMMDHPGVKK
jgi:hypothetical protein